MRTTDDFAQISFFCKVSALGKAQEGGAGVLLRCPVPEGGETGRSSSLELKLHLHQPPPSKVKQRCPGSLCTAHLRLMSIISVLSCWFRGHQLESERA